MRGNRGFGGTYDKQKRTGRSRPGTILVRGLCYTTTASSLRTFFTRTGVVTSVAVEFDPVIGIGTGQALVNFASPDAAEVAIRTLDGHEFLGSVINVVPLTFEIMRH